MLNKTFFNLKNNDNFLIKFTKNIKLVNNCVLQPHFLKKFKKFML